VLLPEIVRHVLDGVQAEAVQPHPLRQTEMRLIEIVGHLGQLGLEVRQAGDARGDVVLAAGAQAGGAHPAAEPRVPGVLRIVARMVVDHVEQHLHAAAVGVVHQGLEIRLAAETRVEALEVVRPIAVITPVREAGASDEAVDVLDHRGDPQRGDPEIGQLVELQPQAGEIAAVEGPLGGAVHPLVIACVAVGETVDEDEIKDAVGPVPLRLDRDRGVDGRSRRPYLGSRSPKSRVGAAREKNCTRRRKPGEPGCGPVGRLSPQRHLPPVSA